MTEAERKNREMLQGKKPLVYDKVITHAEKIKRKESVAMVQLQYRYDCNFKCAHCAVENLKKEQGRQLSIADVKRIADQLDAMGLASICISGGEPIMFPDLKDVVDAIDPLRFNIAMDTNGWLLTEEKIKWLTAIGIDRIQLSMDGLARSHNAFRGTPGSFERCVETLRLCKKNGLRVIINVVATKSLLRSGELIKHLDYLSQFGEHISVIHAKPVGAFAEKQDEILDSDDFACIQSLTGRYNMSTHQSPNCGHDFGCFCMKRWFSITAYGDVMPCPWIPVSLGNVFDEDLKSIVERGLGIRWFSYDYKPNCLAGNKDDFFYQYILPQATHAKNQPVSWKSINWHECVAW